MTTEPNDEKELLRLCGLMVDGQLDETDRQRLSALLSADASARAFYRSYMDAHAGLLLHYGRVAASTSGSRREQTGLDVDKAQRLLQFFGLGAVSHIAKENRPRRETWSEKEVSQGTGIRTDTERGKRLLAFFGLDVVS
ncbi:MAG: hypothetical protein ACYTG0_46130 [Planctomycetota bacterium]|jgi:hypothetical protein